MASMFYGYHFAGAPSLFSGAGFMTPESTQLAGGDPPFSPVKNRGFQGSLPLTVKQTAGGYNLVGDDKSSFNVDGVDVINVRLLGMVMNKVERASDVSFTLDDGTGRIDINRWVNEVSDAQEVAAMRNGMYVKVNGHLKGFQGKRHAVAYSIRPVVDFNDIVLHFLDCMYVHVENIRKKGGTLVHIQAMDTTYSGSKVCQTPVISQAVTYPGINESANDICNRVLNVFHKPEILCASSCFFYIHLVASGQAFKLSTCTPPMSLKEIVPSSKDCMLMRSSGNWAYQKMDVVSYHVDAGNIYSTVDEYHFKSACNGGNMQSAY